MSHEYLTKSQIEKRIEKLDIWIAKNPNDPMLGTVKKESMFYAFLLKDIKELKLKSIKNTVPTQMYNQIGVLI